MGYKLNIDVDYMILKRNQMGLTLRTLAELIGTTYQHVNKWECGRNTPNCIYREKLITVLELDRKKFVISV